MRNFSIRSPRALRSLALGIVIYTALLSIPTTSVQAATFLTFVDDYAGFEAAVGAGSVVSSENFATAVNGTPVGPAGSPDTWNGFTASAYGTGTGPYGASKYCTDLSAATCINWNTSTPAMAGIYGSVGTGPTIGISFKPTSNTIAGFSFDFVDWNDGGQRSEFVVIASDATETVVTGPINAWNAPPQNFAVTLSTADIAAGKYITEIRLVGVAGQAEVVGFYNFKFLTNPVLESGYTVTPSAGANGSIDPSTPQTVNDSETTSFTVTPNTGYSIASVTGCGGSLSGSTYTTGAITSACTVTANFSLNSHAAPAATGTGDITASFTGGGAECGYSVSQFIPLTGHTASPPAGTAPAGVSFPHGLFDFTTSNCTPGSTITMVITYPQALPAGTVYWKYGPTPTDGSYHWYQLPATISGNTATF
ncbi:MAG: choice-of-anchor U domain-containing protein, partial [Thiobacillus sp.]|nr:choice-of-anchor U domain-containing protein [Thiobacillus sp.]